MRIKSSYLGTSDLGVLLKLQSSWRLELQSPQAWLLQMVLIRMAVQRPQVLTDWLPPQSYSQHGSWLPPRSKREQKRVRSLSALHNLILEGTCYHFCRILSVTQTSPGTWGKAIQDWIPGGRDHWGPSWRLATTKHIFLDLSYFSWNSSLVFQDNIPSWFFCFQSFSYSHPSNTLILIFLKHID